MVLTYEIGGEKHGAKFGASLTITDDTCDFVNFYQNEEKEAGQLLLSGADDKAIWLDGTQGKSYSGFTTIDASAMKGNAALAGGTAAETIIGGHGDNSLWGGTGGDDTLHGGNGCNKFYFGLGEGKDLITGSHDEDKVVLYNASLSDIDTAHTGLKDGNMVIVLNDGSKLAIEDFSYQGAATVELTDGTWAYDKATGSWLPKESS